MSAAALQRWLERERARAAALLQLDDELGTRHGMSWADFVVLHSLDSAADGLTDGDLAARLGMLRSHCLLRVRPLEKIGLLSRGLDDQGRRIVGLRSAGRKLLREAQETAAMVCGQLPE